MSVSTVFLLIFSGIIAALIAAAFRNAANPHDQSCYRPEPRGSIDHAVHKEII
jgi:hypothetical protein